MYFRIDLFLDINIYCNIRYVVLSFDQIKTHYYYYIIIIISIGSIDVCWLPTSVSVSSRGRDENLGTKLVDYLFEFSLSYIVMFAQPLYT